MQRHHAVDAGDQCHLIRPIQRLVPHTDVVATVGCGEDTLVVRAALVSVHRLDDQDRSLVGCERPTERLDHAERVLAFGDAEVIEDGEEERPLADVGERGEVAPIAIGGLRFGDRYRHVTNRHRRDGGERVGHES